MHGLLLQIARKAMAVARADHVCDRVPSEEDSLPSDDGHPKERARLAQRERDQQMHALVLRLGQQRVDPAMVPAHEPQRSHMPQHPCDHAGYACDRLQEDDAPQPVLLCHGCGPDLHLVERANVEPKAAGLHSEVSDTFDEVFRLVVRLLDSVQLLLGPSGLRHQVAQIQILIQLRGAEDRAPACRASEGIGRVGERQGQTRDR
mmetsp:Transcript_31849/g.105597  ORF Transcript_31849/g.105597 Transcript_31849/m.105597 type:complete len:204 (-) Transcript_31849:92-703(-)